MLHRKKVEEKGKELLQSLSTMKKRLMGAFVIHTMVENASRCIQDQKLSSAGREALENCLFGRHCFRRRRMY